jgi:DNA-binding response OmpR family regulator
MTETLLVVDPDGPAQSALVETLSAGRYRSITADGFTSAIQLLQVARPDLLITVARLDPFSGVHLVTQGRAADPRMAAVVIDDHRDDAARAAALTAGATAYLTRPVAATDLLICVAEALAGRERRCWRRTALANDVLVGIRAGQARLLDIGYGGFRLEFGTPDVHHELKLDLPILGLSLHARRVWSCRTPIGTIWSCGAALVSPHDSDSTQRWRRLVDTVRSGTAFDSPYFKR